MKIIISPVILRLYNRTVVIYCYLERENNKIGNFQMNKLS